MNVAGYLTLILFVIDKTKTVSLLTDDNAHNSTHQNLVGVDSQNVDVFRQLLNQETIIRMTLVKNVHALMKDMLSLKENFAVAEQKLSTLQASTAHEISVLKTEVQSLKLENNVLKNESREHKRDVTEMKANIVQISENHKEFEKEIDVNREVFQQNVSDKLADIKIEVRYLSITLLDLNAHTRQIESEIPDIIDQKILAMFESINSTLENFNATVMATDNKFATQFSDLKNSHSGVLSTLTDYLNTTVDSLKAELKDSKFEQLKLSSAVTSLEMFRMNLTNNLQTKVAFTAGVTSSSSTWNSGTLVFPVVINNIGGGYNPSTGVFTAPTEGHYVFFVTVVEYNKQDSRVEIVLNGSSKVGTMGHPSAGYQTGANMAVLRLQQGDTVWIKHYHGKGYYTETVPLTTFSGFLL
ncbi:multimerin-2 isoform X2 [Ostrea edulis]|uniref:multimerin-2 isoform X2 n=1 Tax=Ostrea edulis TaxID=37623 RepID=UPI0024AEC720|nr:multimerin-2 isoform X2 [Ostrea edulis]